MIEMYRTATGDLSCYNLHVVIARLHRIFGERCFEPV